MPSPVLTVKMLLPFRIFAEHADVRSMVVEADGGSFGILPHRRDCVAALVPGILTFTTASAGEIHVAVDAGVLIKSGFNILVSVRQAMIGKDLGSLRAAVEQDYLTLDADERSARAAVVKLESGFVNRFAAFQHER